jgi:hypothetical protein
LRRWIAQWRHDTILRDSVRRRLSLFVTHFDAIVRKVAAKITAGKDVAFGEDAFAELTAVKQLKRIAHGPGDSEAEGMEEFDAIAEVVEDEAVEKTRSKRSRRKT